MGQVNQQTLTQLSMRREEKRREEKIEGKATRNKQQLKEAAAWKSITKEQYNSLVMSMGHRLHVLITGK